MVILSSSEGSEPSLIPPIETLCSSVIPQVRQRASIFNPSPIRAQRKQKSRMPSHANTKFFKQKQGERRRAPELPRQGSKDIVLQDLPPKTEKIEQLMN